MYHKNSDSPCDWLITLHDGRIKIWMTGSNFQKILSFINYNKVKYSIEFFFFKIFMPPTVNIIDKHALWFCTKDHFISCQRKFAVSMNNIMMYDILFVLYRNARLHGSIRKSIIGYYRVGNRKFVLEGQHCGTLCSTL